uniref:NADH-quinone oxidoreductase n=1 Tax=uncultured Thiotrichaceae bacterium TaxID=298394 RepID=A0A6S6UDG9_9GAMM|nr:MAG: NADH-ubiquinone oxidoreductase chain G (EC [uncultured Thiotrichaceae bacterium]
MTDQSAEMVIIEVNAAELQAPSGAMLIDVMDEAGITVPRFCYHKKLSVSANCRMCLVEVEKSDKPLPACATPVNAGMKVWTRSEKARAAQEDVMEFLLINHPLDCPVCDQGGECELQDVSVGYGKGSSQFTEIKRVVNDKDIGPLIETEMTRCIHCMRCVRFGEEIAGLRELGATGRSEHVEIGTYVSKSISSELSGNIIDLCPVGALTAKPSRYKARAWEMRSHNSIAPHDSVGSNITVHTFDNEVVRVVPAENDAINECWISDRDRFSYQGLSSHDRLLKPQVKRDGQWQEVDWHEALDMVAVMLSDVEGGQVGALASPTSTLEELYLFQKLMRGAGIPNIDHRLRQVDFSDQAYVSAAPVLGQTIEQLEQQQAVLLLGSNARQEQPLLNQRLKKVVAAGGVVMALNPRAVSFNYDVEQLVVKPMNMVAGMAAIVCALSELSGKSLSDDVADVCDGIEFTDRDKQIAAHLLDAEHSMVLMGNMAMQHPQMATLRALSSVISALSGSVCGYLQEAANTVGAALAGVLPHRTLGGVEAEVDGLHAADMIAAKLSTYVLMNVESDDFANPFQANAAFSGASDVIAITPFADEQMREYATVLLPGTTFAETSGTFVNAEGSWQGFSGVAKPPGDARPGWKILRVLGNKLELPEFDYVSSQELASELKLELQLVKPSNQYSIEVPLEVPEPEDRMQRIGDIHMYRSDMLVRRADALQKMIPMPLVHLNPLDMERLDFDQGDLIKAAQGEGSVQLPVKKDASVPEGCVWIQGGTTAANTLGELFGYIDLDRI